MGIYLNPDNEKFKSNMNDDIFLDKSLIIAETNRRLKKNKGKSETAENGTHFWNAIYVIN